MVGDDSFVIKPRLGECVSPPQSTMLCVHSAFTCPGTFCLSAPPQARARWLPALSFPPLIPNWVRVSWCRPLFGETLYSVPPLVMSATHSTILPRISATTTSCPNVSSSSAPLTRPTLSTLLQARGPFQYHHPHSFQFSASNTTSGARAKSSRKLPDGSDECDWIIEPCRTQVRAAPGIFRENPLTPSRTAAHDSCCRHR
jgi:hypothetical protein